MTKKYLVAHPGTEPYSDAMVKWECDAIEQAIEKAERYAAANPDLTFAVYERACAFVAEAWEVQEVGE